MIYESSNARFCYSDEEYYRLMSSNTFSSFDNRLCSITGQACTPESSYTDDTEDSNNYGYAFNSQSLPSNCEVIDGYMIFNEDDSESEDLKQKLSSIRIIVGSLYIQYSSFTTFELPNLEYFIGMLLIDPYASTNISVMMVSNPALSVSQTACDRWTQLGFSLIINDNAANCG
ncbi:hypothetical protein WR25_13591 [Diploscapter pachys]|uniref:Receptor L-domain domain-containing protein n=1 Tax=Diploscapter pachys TaxID=2018661 RepID=A0A2A2LCF6_9BILA|nr:hypothetical protein WR25_13591 [Diploscapter pachys]